MSSENKRDQNTFMPKNINSIAVIITLKNNGRGYFREIHKQDSFQTVFVDLADQTYSTEILHIIRMGFDKTIKQLKKKEKKSNPSLSTCAEM